MNACSENVWDTLADSSAQANDLKNRSTTMRRVRNAVKASAHASHEERANLLKISTQKYEDLMSGCIDKFDQNELDSLLHLATLVLPKT